MSMFDRVHLENDIPDPDLRYKEWQTQSLRNALFHYRVTSDGELIVKRERHEFVEAPQHPLGFQQNLVAKWEEKVDHHGIVETYCLLEHDDGSRSMIFYDLYFSYGKLDRLERREEYHAPPRGVESVEDPAPVKETRVGDYSLHLPESIEVKHASAQGELLLVKLKYPGIMVLNRASRGEPAGTIIVSGRCAPADDEPENSTESSPLVTTKSAGQISHAAGAHLKVLAEKQKLPFYRSNRYLGPTIITAAIGPIDLLGS